MGIRYSAGYLVTFLGSVGALTRCRGGQLLPILGPTLGVFLAVGPTYDS